MWDERESLRKQLAEAEANLRLVRERMAEYVLGVEAPLQLVKEERRLEARIAELRAEIQRGSGRYVMRSPVADFTGRQTELDALVAHLSQDGATAQITGIRGMGGLGKTELALVIAARLRERYPDAQLMLELQPGDRPLTPEQVLAGVVRTFLPELKVPDDLVELQHLYRRAMTGRRGLLLLDNAAGPEQVRPLVPAPAGWAVVVTSRERFPLSGARLCNLDVLPMEDAVTLLRRLLADGAREEGEEGEGEKGEGEETSPLRDLAELCGRLPLALRVAAGHLTSYPDVKLARYLVELREARLAHLDAPGEPDAAAVLGLSVARLEQDDPELARRWRELAAFPTSFDWQAAAAVWGTLAVASGEDADVRLELTPLAEEPACRALRSLTQRSLVEYDSTSERYGLHELLRAYVRETLGDQADLDAARVRHAWYYQAWGLAANDLCEQGGEHMVDGLRLFDVIWPHLTAAWRWLRGQGGAEATRWVNAFPDAVTYVWDLRVTPDQQIPLLEAAVAAARALGDRRGEGAHLNDLGLAFWALGQAEQAIRCYEQALAISREIGDRHGEGNALGNLGIAYWTLGQVEQAIGYYQRALAISRALDDHRNEGNWLGNLGIAYKDLGQVEQAISYYQQALAICRALGDRRGEGNWLGSLGIAYAALGQAEESISYYQQALAISREIGDRRREGNHLGNLGIVHATLGQVEQAIGYYQQALAISREISNRRGESAHLGNLGLAYATLGQVEQAICCYQQARAISREIGDRRGEGSHAWNLGLAYERQDRYAEAAELMQIKVDYECEIGHPDAEAHGRRLEETRRDAERRR